VEVIERRIEDITDSELAHADVIVSFEVIEHLFDPKDLIRQAARLLKPGGLLVLSCPNGLGYDIAMLGAGSQAVDAEHVNLFNPASLGGLLEKSGFGVLETTTPGRLDAEIVREAVLADAQAVQLDPVMHRILIEDWDGLGWPFQQFLAANGLSSHMWIAARRL